MTQHDDAREQAWRKFRDAAPSHNQPPAYEAFHAGFAAALHPQEPETVTLERIADAILDADLKNPDIPFLDRRHEYARAIAALYRGDEQ